jgi:hypothetical protein
MKYIVEISSETYIPNFIKTDSTIQRLMGGGGGYTESMVIP